MAGSPRTPARQSTRTTARRRTTRRLQRWTFLPHLPDRADGGGQKHHRPAARGSTDKTFVDADHALEERTGVDIPLIFEIEGEAGFRKRESELLAELVLREGIVLATGGGAVLSARNRAHLAGHGFVIYLDAPIDLLVARWRGIVIGR